MIDRTGIDALEIVEVGMAQCRISRDVGERLPHRLALEKTMDQLAMVKIGCFDKTHEGPTVTLEFLRNVRIGIEGFGEFPFALVLLDLGG